MANQCSSHRQLSLDGQYGHSMQLVKLPVVRCLINWPKCVVHSKTSCGWMADRGLKVNCSYQDLMAGGQSMGRISFVQRAAVRWQIIIVPEKKTVNG